MIDYANRRDTPGFDVMDLTLRRTFYESLRGRMWTDVSTWMPHWYQLSAYFLPRDQRFVQEMVNTGFREDYNIINNTPGQSLNVLCSGMLTNMTPPTSAWFRLRCKNSKINLRSEAREYFEEVEDIIRGIFIKSNFYQSLLTLYREEGLYGTGAFLMEKDTEPDKIKNTVIRCKPYPIGSYTLGCDDQLRIDMSMRRLSMKVRDEVTAFGYDNVSMSVQQLNDTPSGGTKEDWRKIIHFIHKASYFGTQAERITRMPWISCQYELDSFDPSNAILRTEGYWENPLIVGRWDVVGENVYGESPAMNVLGDAMSLQSYEDRLAQGTEKMIDPPLLANSAIDSRKITTLPGGITFVDSDDVRKLIGPAYEFDFGKGGEMVQQQIKRLEDRINDGMFRQAFQPLTNLDRRQMTAEETRGRQQEALQILGPIVERNVEEVLSPAVNRCLGIAYRAGLLPKMPECLHGQPLSIGFESVIATAERMRKVQNITTWLSLVGSEAAVDQGALDNVDIDETVREIGALDSVPVKLMRSKEAVATIRADRQRAQQQQQNAENAKNLSAAGANLAQAKTSDGSNLLDQVPGLLKGAQP